MTAIDTFSRRSIKCIFVFAAILTFGPILASAQCSSEPTLSEVGNVLRKLKFVGSKAAEVGLTIKAGVPGGSWGTPGAEAAVLTVFVDGKYNQDVALFAGAVPFDYKVSLGRIESGSHEIAVSLNKKRSAAKAQSVNIAAIEARPLAGNGALHHLAVANSPVIYARENTVDRFSDIPLVTYYETLEKPDGSVGIRYTTIFTNEDGGTQTTALMARWGRATDIEWVYEVWFRDGKRVSEIYQRANHQTTEFRGLRIVGDHPLINNVTVNNNFSDEGCSRLRFSPLPQAADLTARSRETVMDANPWTHRIMAEEAIREGRVDATRLGPNVIDDPRNYVYVDLFNEKDSVAVALELTTLGGQVSRSDHGDERLRIKRPGYQRIAVRLPAASKLKSINLVCYGETPGCGGSHLLSYIRLGKDFMPTTIWRLGG